MFLFIKKRHKDTSFLKNNGLLKKIKYNFYLLLQKKASFLRKYQTFILLITNAFISTNYVNKKTLLEYDNLKSYFCYLKHINEIITYLYYKI